MTEITNSIHPIYVIRREVNFLKITTDARRVFLPSPNEVTENPPSLNNRQTHPQRGNAETQGKNPSVYYLCLASEKKQESIIRFYQCPLE